MNGSDELSIGRAGGGDDEPAFAAPPSRPAGRTADARSSEASALGRAGGEFDEPDSPPSAPVEVAAVEPDAFVSLPGPEGEPDGPRDAGGSGNGWFALAASLAFWGVAIWLAVQVAGLVRTTLALPLVLRVPALAGEAAAAAVTGIWLVRVAGLFFGFRKRPDGDWPAYYRRIGKSETFAREFPEEKRENALETVRFLSLRQAGMAKEWEAKAEAFESERRKVAEDIVGKHALLTAVKTATSPWKILDVAAVFYNNTRMVERIARLYGQRCTGPQAFRLVCQWGFNLYVAGELGDVMEKGAEATAGKAAELLQNTGGGLSWLGGVLPAAGKIFAKAGEGAANYYLCKRLGTAAVAAFGPDLSRPPARRRRSPSEIWATVVLALLVSWFLFFGVLAAIR